MGLNSAGLSGSGAGGGGGGGGVTSFNSRTGVVTLSDADVATILAAFTTTSGVDIADNSANGIDWVESGSGGVSATDAGGGGLYWSSTLAQRLIAPSNGSWFVTATNLASLPTPAAGQTPSFGWTQDGNLYFYPTGGPWEVVGPLVTGDVDITGAASTLIGTANVESIIRANRLDQMAVPTAKLNFGGEAVGNAADGTFGTDLATVEQTAGWIQDSNAWTRTSNTTFTVPGNLTAIYLPGTVVKWQESAVQKYGVVVSSAFTSLTTVTIVQTTISMAASPDANTNFYSHGVPTDLPAQFTWSGIAQAGWSGSPTLLGFFSVVGPRRIEFMFYISGTSNATTATCTLPIAAAASNVFASISAQDNATSAAWANTTTMPGACSTTASSNTLSFGKGANVASGAWTASNTKTIIGQLIYPV